MSGIREAGKWNGMLKSSGHHEPPFILAPGSMSSDPMRYIGHKAGAASSPTYQMNVALTLRVVGHGYHTATWGSFVIETLMKTQCYGFGLRKDLHKLFNRKLYTARRRHTE